MLERAAFQTVVLLLRPPGRRFGGVVHYARARRRGLATESRVRSTLTSVTQLLRTHPRALDKRVRHAPVRDLQKHLRADLDEHLDHAVEVHAEEARDPPSEMSPFTHSLQVFRVPPRENRGARRTRPGGHASEGHTSYCL